MIEVMERFGYQAFGLNLISELALPELPQLSTPAENVDVEITIGDLAKEWASHILPPKKAFVVNESMIMFQVPGTAIFKVEGGKRITVMPIMDSKEDRIRLLLLGTCMGAILMQRKTLPLHGSVIAIDGKAYAIVGDSGVGKSTLASAFLKRGFGLLTDDVIAVSFSEDGIPFVTPSYPQQKLWSESLDHFGMESSNYQTLIDREDKFAIPVVSQFVEESLPLAGIFELVKGDYDGIAIQPIGNLEGLFKLYYHTYRNFFLERSGLMEWHFQTTTKMMNKIIFYHLKRPIDKFTAHDLTDLILDTIKREELINA